MSNSKQLKFELANDPAVIRFTHIVGAEKWKGKLTAEQYADREWIVAEGKSGQQKLDGSSGLFHFVLRDESIPVGSNPKTDNVVSSIEILKRRGWRIAPNGEIEDVSSACIGAVYTLPHHRKKGYGRALLSAANDYIEKDTGPRGFGFLYSEIGEFYSQFGYKSFHVPVHIIEANQTVQDPRKDIEYLSLDSFGNLVDFEYNILRDKLVEKCKVTGKILVSLAPDVDIYSVFHSRDVFIAKSVFPKLKVEHFGAQIKDSNDYIVWTHDWNDDVLVILNVFLEKDSRENFVSLISAAIKEAQLYRFKKVKIWDAALGEARSVGYNSALQTLKSLQNSILSTTNTSLSAIRLNDELLNASDDYIWENNAKWCWF